MKLTSTILKLIAVLLAAFAVVCLVMANLERITRCVDAVSARLQAKKAVSYTHLTLPTTSRV